VRISFSGGAEHCERSGASLLVCYMYTHINEYQFLYIYIYIYANSYTNIFICNKCKAHFGESLVVAALSTTDEAEPLARLLHIHIYSCILIPIHI